MIFRESDEAAACRYRLFLAGEIIRSINVVSYGNGGEKIVTRLVEKLTIVTNESEKVTTRNTYVPVNVIIAKPSLLGQLLKELDKTIDEYAQKRNRLKAYASAREGVLVQLETRDSRMMEIMNA